MRPPALRVPRWAYRFLIFPLMLVTGWVVFSVCFRMHVRDRRLLPRRGGVILVSNHRSYMDGLVVQMVTNRPMRYLMTADWFYSPRMRWFYEMYGCIPIGGGHSGVESLGRAVEALDGGDIITIFPEGGVASDGSLQHFRRGAAVLAYRSGAAVVPVFLCGTHEVMPKGSSFPRPRRIEVLVGEPFSVPRTSLEEIDPEAVNRLARGLQERVAALGRKALGDVPATRIPARSAGGAAR